MTSTRETNRGRQPTAPLADDPGPSEPIGSQDNATTVGTIPESIDPTDLIREEEDLVRRLEIAQRRRRVEALRKQVAALEATDLGAGDSLEGENNSRIRQRSASDTPGEDPKRARQNNTSRLVEKPPEYSGKTLRSFHNFVRGCEIAFRVRPSSYDSDAAKILLAMQYLQGDPADAWEREERTRGEDNTTWEGFKRFLQDLSSDPANRGLTVAQSYDKAYQGSSQTV